MAALLCVREDRLRAAQLAALLSARGFELDSSATAFERPSDYEASIALFSPGAVKSSLLLWAAKQAQDARRLVPIFVSLTALPRAFSLSAIHDLTEWNGEEDHQGLLAVQRHLLRLQRARSDHEALAQLGRGRPGEPAEAATPARAPVAPAPQFAPAVVKTGVTAATLESAANRRADRIAPQRPVATSSLGQKPGSLFSASRSAAAPALRLEPEHAMDADTAAPNVSAAARRRRLILRERMLSGLPLD